MEAATFRDHEWRSREGLTLYAREYGEAGDKLPVICVPGLTRNSRDLEDVAPWIAQHGRHTFAVDLRGRGRSDRTGDPRCYNPRVYAADIAALLDSIGASQAIFIGTSLGGLVVMSLALARPTLIGAAVLNDVGPRVAKAGLARIRSYAGKTALVETWADAAAYAKTINGVAFPDLPDETWATVARRMFTQDGARPVLDYDRRIFRAPHPIVAWLAQPLLWKAFRRLHKAGPLMLLYGELTDVLDESTIRRMKQAAPSISAVAVPRVGHAPMLSEPAAQRALVEFLSRAP